jgi:hypothetical protein
VPILFPPVANRPTIYTTDGWDTRWRTAKAGAGSAQAKIWVVGDSTTQGTSQLTDVLVDVWIRKLLNGLPSNPWVGSVGGDFFSPAYSQTYWTAQSAGTIPGPIIPFTGLQATGRFVFSHPYGSGYWWDSTASTLDLITFNTPYACTDIDIVTLDYVAAGASWSYKVDGGSPTVVTYASGSTSTTAPRRTQLTGLANTTHAILITNPTAANGAHMLLGCTAYKNRTTGICTAWADGTGAPFSGVVIPNFPSTNGFLLPQGYLTTAQTGTGFGFPAQPDLAIFAMGINDCQGNGLQPEGFRQGLRKMCQCVRRGTANASILMLIMSNEDSQSSDMTSAWFANSNLWNMYIEAMMAVAREFHCAVVNMHARWGELAATNTYIISASNAHPSAVGHTDIANQLLTIL